jgi:hypothetical protein
VYIIKYTHLFEILNGCNFINYFLIIKMSENSILELCTPPLTLEHEWASGAFGNVYLADTPTCKVSVKCVPQLEGYVNRELTTCKQVAKEKNPNIVKFLGYWIENTNLFLVMEFIPNTLNSILTTDGMRPDLIAAG